MKPLKPTEKENIQRGDVFWTELDPVRGSEMAKTRPCIILSINTVNRMRNTVVILPLTSTPEAARFPLLLEIPSAGDGSKVRTEHIRSVDKSRIKGRIGRINDHDMDEISRAIARILGLT